MTRLSTRGPGVGVVRFGWDVDRVSITARITVSYTVAVWIVVVVVD
jgi:hypothetical protein